MAIANDSTAGPAAGAHALRETRVGKAMHVGVLTCPVEAPLSEVARIMASEQVHCVVVMSRSQDGVSFWGVVSDLDLVAGASVRNLEEQSAGGTAASPVVLIAPDDTLLRAAQLMIENATTHLVVVDPESGLPVGVLSTLDVARTVSPTA
jgi:CBS domain-containing protein